MANSPTQRPIETCIKEIFDENTQLLERLDSDAAALVVSVIQSAPKIFLLGVGRSGLIARMFAMRLMHLGLCAFCVGDVTTPSIQPGDALICFSVSGETATTCLLAEKAKQFGADVVAFTGNRQSKLAALAGVLMMLESADAELSKQFGGSRCEQSMFILCEALVLQIIKDFKQDFRDLYGRHANLE